MGKRANGLRLLLWFLLGLGALHAARGAAEEAPSSRWEPAIQRFEASDRSSPPAPGGVVFVGSSSIRLWTTLIEDFPGVNVINRGFGGSELSDAIEFVGRIVLPYRPRMVVLYAGDNDLARGKTPERVLQDTRAFVERVQREQPQARIVFVSIKPSLARAALLQVSEEANRLVREYAAERSGLEFVDVVAPMLDREGRPRAELFIDDGLHMNEQGYALWRAALAPFVEARPEP